MSLGIERTPEAGHGCLDTSTADPPVHRLPPEILSYIFNLCLPDNPHATPIISNAPLLVSRVTKAWRNISMSTPELWASFHVSLETSITKPYPYGSPATKQLIHALENFVARAGSLPLSLGLSFSPNYGKMLDETGPLVKTMISHFPKCRQLTLHLGSVKRRDSIRYDSYPWYRLSKAKFPILEELDIGLPYTDAKEFLAMSLSFTPRLRKVTLAGFPPSLLTFVPVSTLLQLTELRSTAAESVQDCCEILRLSPDLQQCRFDLHCSDHIESTHAGLSPSVLHKQLRKLYVGPTDLDFFFASVTFPALQILSINGSKLTVWDPTADIFDFDNTITYEAKWGQLSFLAFLTRSLCSLTKLSLYHLNLTSKLLIEILESVSPTLNELHIEGGELQCITQSVMNVLTYRPPDQPKGTLGRRFFCPLLERIRIRGYIFEFGGSGRSMVDMLESRFRQQFPIDGLKQLRWAFVGGKYNKKQWERITALENDGLELIVVEEGSKYIPDYLSVPALFDCEASSIIFVLVLNF